MRLCASAAAAPPTAAFARAPPEEDSDRGEEEEEASDDVATLPRCGEGERERADAARAGLRRDGSGVTKGTLRGALAEPSSDRDGAE